LQIVVNSPTEMRKLSIGSQKSAFCNASSCIYTELSLLMTVHGSTQIFYPHTLILVSEYIISLVNKMTAGNAELLIIG